MAKRSDIRKALKSELDSLGIFDLVYPYLPPYVDPENTPAAAIYMDAGLTEQDFDNDHTTSATINIQMIVRGAGDLEEQLDSMSDLINEHLDNHNTLNGVVSGIYRSGFVYDREPESLSCSLTNTYQINFDEE